MRKRRVVVTGMGAVSCFGLGVEALWAGLTSCRSGEAPIRRFDASTYRSDLAAEVPQYIWDRADLRDMAGYPQEEAALLATLAAEEAFSDAGIRSAGKRDIGCVVGTLCSGSTVFESYGKQFAKFPLELESFPDIDACAVAYQLEHLVRHFKLGGPSSLISTACSSSTDAIGYAFDIIRSGSAEVMLVGGADILSEVVHAGFNSVFSITKDRAKPFDETRSGFFIGEGSGMLVLEDLEHAHARGARIYAEVLGYGLSNTAYHLTATSDDGVGEAMAIERCLCEAGVSASEVQYVNAHGTSTQHNDLTEIKALRRVFDKSLEKLLVTSIKANIGHCMGASGVLEAVATIKCIVDSYIPPTLNSSGDVGGDIHVLVGEGVNVELHYALSQSFGFGGASSAVLFGAMKSNVVPNSTLMTD